jgi:hypothetical protein
LQALDALMTFWTGWTRIALRSALAAGAWRTDAGGAGRTGWAWRTERTCRTGRSVQSSGAALCEQLARDGARVDGAALFDRSESLLGCSDARVELRRVDLGGLTRDQRDQREPLHV